MHKLIVAWPKDSQTKYHHLGHVPCREMASSKEIVGNGASSATDSTDHIRQPHLPSLDKARLQIIQSV